MIQPSYCGHLNQVYKTTTKQTTIKQNKKTQRKRPL